MIIKATYSPEDNKLRIYTNGDRVGDEAYAKVRDAGFRWAPKQKLFVTPKWTPAREDLCLSFVEDIELEEITMIERAESKADRLEEYQRKKLDQANCFAAVASEISASISYQPVLSGHHSQRKIEKQLQRAETNKTKSEESYSRAKRLTWKIDGVLHHANRKNDSSVRLRRIKTLLTDLRSWQRKLTEAFICKQHMLKADNYDKTLAVLNYFRFGGFQEWSNLNDKKVCWMQARKNYLERCDNVLNSSSVQRCMEHVLNRLSYERTMLGTVAVFADEITPVVLQAFAREQGAEKPKAVKSEKGFVLRSLAPLPRHMSDCKELDLSEQGWRDLMNSCGHSPKPKIQKAKQPSKPPLLNIPSDVELKGPDGGWKRNFKAFPRVTMTKETHSKVRKDIKTTKLSECGQFRFRVVFGKNPQTDKSEWLAVFLTDSKSHSLPEPLENAA